MGPVNLESLDDAVDEVQTFGNKIFTIALCILFPIACFIDHIFGFEGIITLGDIFFAIAGVGLGFHGGAEGLAHRLEKILMQNTN